jgi:hypothetical protein
MWIFLALIEDILARNSLAFVLQVRKQKQYWRSYWGYHNVDWWLLVSWERIMYHQNEDCKVKNDCLGVKNWGWTIIAWGWGPVEVLFEVRWLTIHNSVLRNMGWVVRTGDLIFSPYQCLAFSSPRDRWSGSFLDWWFCLSVCVWHSLNLSCDWSVWLGLNWCNWES